MLGTMFIGGQTVPCLKNEEDLGIEIINIKGQAVPVVTSRKVADDFEKQHKHVLEAIENIKAENSAVTRMFIESSYKAGTGKNYKEYLLTRDGFSLLVMGFTGPKALNWKLKYIEAFNKMEEHIKGQAKPLTTEEMLELQFKYAKEVKEEVRELKDDFNSFKDNAPLFNVECDDLMERVRSIATKILGGYGSPAYKNRSLSSRVYSDIQYQIRREFQVRKYKAIKRKDLEKALEILSNYKAPLVLADEIRQINNQIDFEEVI